MKLVMILLLALNYNVFASEIRKTDFSAPPSHELWDSLLKEYVSANGKVNYESLKKNRGSLQKYLDLLATHHPGQGWSKDEQMAYWINAYNAFTIELILRNWPVKSIKDINNPWKQKFIKLGDRIYDLDYLEHKILRAEFNDPRIHFAIVCASYSCPPLRNEAYRADKLDVQLTDQARRFINDPRYNKISTDAIQISQLFHWYRKDFIQKNDLITYINNYSDVKVSATARISYLEYIWKLND